MLAAAAMYVGSKEHKSERWWGGAPGAKLNHDGAVKPRPHKQKTTICPVITGAGRDTATAWVQEAIRDGKYHFVQGDKDFPKHLWHTVDGQDWFGFCINSIAGEYKGWPLEQGELNAFLDQLA